jgi:cytochrome c2
MNNGRAMSVLASMLWHLAGLAALVLTGRLLIGKPVPSMERGQQLFMLALAAAFVLSAGVNIWWPRRHFAKWQVAIRLLLVTAVFGCAAFGLLLIRAPYLSGAILVASIALTTIVLIVARWARTVWMAGAALVLLGIGIGVLAKDAAPPALLARIVPRPLRSGAVVNTNYGALSATYYDNYFPVCDASGSCDYTPRTGGGVDGLADGYLVATGEGFLHYVTRDAQGGLAVSQLPYRVPINNADFAATGESPFGQNVFRVADIIVEEHGGETTVYAAHHFYDKTGDCVVLRLSALRGDAAHIVGGTLQKGWDTLYQTKPCLSSYSGPTGPTPDGEAHPLQQSGGRIARLDASTMLMTAGDHNLDGVNLDVIAPQDLNSDYGKTLEIDLGRRTARVFTFGHRNPQGLLVTQSGDIWVTEHGPQGGDELNRLVRGTNYGWPHVTYGTRYGPGRRPWPLSATPHDHRGFEEPVYSWVPSIAVSNLIEVKKDRFPYWRGDILIGSFRQSLFRARIRSGRVVTLEQVRLRTSRGRIRDLFEDRDGNIVVWFDDGVLAILEPTDSVAAAAPEASDVRGETLFAACAGCHAVADGSNHGLGPDLAGIVNRPIAGSEGFVYSGPMAQLQGRWTVENLDRFLADPQALAPGTTMLFAGLPDAADRARLIAYLKETSRGATR